MEKTLDKMPGGGTLNYFLLFSKSALRGKEMYMKQTVVRFACVAAFCAAAAWMMGCDSNAGSSTGETATETATLPASSTAGGGENDPFKGKSYIYETGYRKITFGTDGTATIYYLNSADDTWYPDAQYRYSYDTESARLYFAMKGMYAGFDTDDTTLYTSASSYINAVIMAAENEENLYYYGSKLTLDSSCTDVLTVVYKRQFVQLATMAYEEASGTVTVTTVYDGITNLGAMEDFFSGDGVYVSGSSLYSNEPSISYSFLITAITDSSFTLYKQVVEEDEEAKTVKLSATAAGTAGYSVDTSGDSPVMTLTIDGTTYENLSYHAATDTLTEVE